jgi:hypothetical protein
MFGQAPFNIEILFTKQGTLMRRSTVALPLSQYPWPNS